MIGGWPLFTQTLLTDLDPKKMKIVSVDALPAELAYVEKGLAPVLLAQPTYLWGYVGVQTIFDKVHFKKDVRRIDSDGARPVTKDNLSTGRSSCATGASRTCRQVPEVTQSDR